MRDRRRKANSWDIAHLAGVSQSTVSRALRGDPMVSAATRERILGVARQLNYHVDKNASSLRRQHTGTLALLFFRPAENMILPPRLVVRESCGGGATIDLV